jgi:hypothetical protein
VIAEWAADDPIEFGGLGWEPGGSVQEAAFGATFQVAKNMLFGLHVAGPGTMSMGAK